MSSERTAPSGENGQASPERASEVVLSVRDVSKCYHIYDKPRDRLKQMALRRFRTYYRPFWALQGINFEVSRGEAVGIVGRNGSGKSTLLQIIAGTLTPTSGEVRLHGRVAALLELGSGFNPEFTGRDNVFLSAAILGIPKREVEARFDEIASFADIGAFIDQPVKMYSSGMHARLAFSVAISVNPDILILDEILSVGDMGFQQKCVARMKKLLDSGVTLLFVSHAPDAVKSLCQKGLFLKDGTAEFFGSAEDAVNRYFGHVRQMINDDAQRQRPAISKSVGVMKNVPGALRYGTGHAQVERVRLLDDSGQTVQAYRFGEWITIEVAFRGLIDVERLDAAFVVRDSAGIDLMGSGTADEGVTIPILKEGLTGTVRFRFQNNLRAGNYGISVTLTQLPDQHGMCGVTLDHVDGCIAFANIGEPRRAVHHKFYQPVTVECRMGVGPAVEVVVPSPAAATRA